MKADIDTEYFQMHKIQLYPTKEQAEFFDKCININRYVYNWALNLEIEKYQKFQEAIDNGEIDDSYRKFLSFYDLCKLLQKEREEKEWLAEIPNITCRSGLINLMNAFNRFFKASHHFKHPKFKSKKDQKKSNQSYNTRSERIFIKGSKIKIEGTSYIETNFDVETKFKGKTFRDASIVRDLFGNYFICFSIIEKKIILNTEKREVIGIDLNKKNYFTLSDGTIYSAPDKQISKLKKGISDYEKRCAIDRHNREKTNPEIEISKRAEKRLNRKRKRYKKLANVMNNCVHNITAEIVKSNPAGIIMEKLDVLGMSKNHFVAKEINFYMFGKCREIMQHKCEKYNIPFKLAPVEFNSSNICSNCGFQKNIKNHNNFCCPNCGMKMNRDINAAKNLANLYYAI